MPSFVIVENMRSKPHYSKKQQSWMRKDSDQYKRGSFENLKRQFAEARRG